MNELQIFNNPEFGQVRTLTREGEPWFVGKDVAVALGYEKPRDAVYKHVEQEDKQENPQRPAENHITPILALQFCGFKEYRGNPHQQAATHQTEHSKIHRGHPVRDKYFSHRYIDPEKYRGSQYAQIPLYKIPHSCFLSVLFTHDYIIIHILGQRPPK